MLEFFRTSLLLLILGALLTLLMNGFTPWWSFFAVSFVAGTFVSQKGFPVFAGALLAGFLVWVGSAFLLQTLNSDVLTQKMAILLPVGSTGLLLLVTGILGGLLAALSAWSGFLIRKAILPQR
jgi:hypothetical protein